MSTAPNVVTTKGIPPPPPPLVNPPLYGADWDESSGDAASTSSFDSEELGYDVVMVDDDDE